MRIGGIQEGGAGLAAGNRSAASALSPDRAIREMTGQRNLRLTPVDPIRTGQMLQKCIVAVSRLFQLSSSTPNTPIINYPFVQETTKNLTDDLRSMQLKVSNIDLKMWLKSQARLDEVLHVSKTVLRISNILKIKEGEASGVNLEDSGDSKSTVLNGLAEVASSLIGDICRGLDTLLRMEDPTGYSHEKARKSQELLAELQGDFELSKRLFDAKALPSAVYDKSEALKQLSESVAMLQDCLEALIEQSEALIVLGKATRDVFDNLSGLQSKSFYERIESEVDILERQHENMLRLKLECGRFLTSVNQGYDPNQDLIAWAHAMLFMPRRMRFEQESDRAQENQLERLELPEYQFD